MSDINLLTRSDTTLLKKRKTARILRVASMVSLIFVILSSLLVFFLKLGSPLSGLKSQETSLISQISNYSNLIVELNIDNQKINAIQDIIQKRPDFTRSIDLLLSDTFSGVNLDGVTLGTNSLSFSASSSTLLALNNLLDELTKLTDQKVFKNVTLSGVTAGQTGYSTSVVIDY